MLSAFKKFIAENTLFSPEDRILLAVSGGIDSVAMCELYHQAGFHFGIAHCNFQLREDDSDRDEEFVADLARKYGCEFYATRFNTEKYARKNGISIQMAARELRYAWFQEVIDEHGFDYVATAHHLDDQLETFFINLSRSTGIGGLHGILPKTGKIIRPLMFAWKKDIEEFIRTEHLVYRKDKSNEEVKYLRNRIRHVLYPVLTGIHPDFPKVLSENIIRIRESEAIYRLAIEQVRKQVLKEKKDRTLLSIPELAQLRNAVTYLYEILSPYGFNYSVVKQIVDAIGQSPGATFYSPTHRITRDRKYFILMPLDSEEERESSKEEYSIRGNSTRISKPVCLTFRKIPANKNLHIPAGKEFAFLDSGKLKFPLTLRRWKPGDAFYPFGKNIRKKVSDFFIDEKIPVPDKEKAWILCSGRKIAWVVGHRIDNRFRVTLRTKEVLVIRRHE